jgi:hypothetical protein
MYTVQQKKLLESIGLDPNLDYFYERKEKLSCWKNPVWLEIQKVRHFSIYGFKRKYKETSKVYKVLGCSHEEYKAHIEKQFLKGMTWENKELWEIDHIIPISSAKTVEEVYVLSKYTNLRPLWRKDNRVKKAKRIYLI